MSLKKFIRVTLAKAPNVLFVIASAQALPPELSGLVSHVTINFPWGSLLAGDPKLIGGLTSVSGPAASIELRLNGGALAEAGWSLKSGICYYNNALAALRPLAPLIPPPA